MVNYVQFIKGCDFLKQPIISAHFCAGLWFVIVLYELQSVILHIASLLELFKMNQLETANQEIVLCPLIRIY